MSQFTRFSTGSSPGPYIATITGDVGLAVGPDGANNINLDGLATTATTSTTLLVTGTPATHTLLVTNPSEIISFIQTTDATPSTLYAYTLSASQSVTFTATFSASKADYSASIGGQVVAVGRRGAAGGAVLVYNMTNYGEDSSGAPTVAIVVSGNNLIFQVTGEAATTYNWRAYVTFITR